MTKAEKREIENAKLCPTCGKLWMFPKKWYLGTAEFYTCWDDFHRELTSIGGIGYEETGIEWYDRLGSGAVDA